MFEQDDLIELFNDSCSVKTLTTKSVLTFTSKPTRTNDHVVMDVLPRYDLQAAHMDSQIFIGDNGEVTDYFLEVMKRDPSMSEAFLDSSTAVVSTDHTTAHGAGDGKIGDCLQYNSILANNREINQLLLREIDQRSGRSTATTDHPTGHSNDGATQDNDDCIRFNKTVTESSVTKINMHDSSSGPPVHSYRQSMNVRSPVIDENSTHVQRHKPKHRLVKKQSKSTGKIDDPSMKSPSYMSPKSYPSANTAVASLDMESSPTTAMDLDAETRIRSLELRLKGQLRTIKILETQLHESRLLVDSKSKQLTTLQLRLKTSLSLSSGPTEDAATTGSSVLSPSLAVASSGTTGHNSPMLALRSALLRSEELTAQFKSQVEFLQSQLSVEQGRRQRSEERTRVLKNLAEKSKERCTALQSHNTELKEALSETTSKLDKHRRSMKEATAEITACKLAWSQLMQENEQQRRATEKAEVSMGDLQLALGHSREEVRKLRSDLQSSQYRTRQLSLEVGMLNERSATAKAQERLSIIRSKPQANISSSSTCRSSFSDDSTILHAVRPVGDQQRPYDGRMIHRNPRGISESESHSSTIIISAAGTYQDDIIDRRTDVTDQSTSNSADNEQFKNTEAQEICRGVHEGPIDLHQNKESIVDNCPADKADTKLPKDSISFNNNDSTSSSDRPKNMSMDDLIARDIEISRRLLSPAAIIQRPPRWRNRYLQDPSTRDAMTQSRTAATAVKENIHPNSNESAVASFTCSDSEVTNERRQTISQKHAATIQDVVSPRTDVEDSSTDPHPRTPPTSVDPEEAPSRRSKVSGTVSFIKQRVASCGLLSMSGLSTMNQQLLSRSRIADEDAPPSIGEVLEQDSGSIDVTQRQARSAEESLVSRPTCSSSSSVLISVDDIHVGIGGNHSDHGSSVEGRHLSKLKLLVEKVKFR